MNSQIRFTETPDGWLDAQTGLEWGKTIGKFSWEDACAAVPPGWRLPTIAELATIVDWSIHSPATELPDTQSGYYWSSTSNAYNPTYAWYVYFGNGTVDGNYKSTTNYVRGVRGGL
jgi:hypothetical protein